MNDNETHKLVKVYEKALKHDIPKVKKEASQDHRRAMKLTNTGPTLQATFIDVFNTDQYRPNSDCGYH